jgi:hypothetical protein
VARWNHPNWWVERFSAIIQRTEIDPGDSTEPSLMALRVIAPHFSKRF